MFVLVVGVLWGEMGGNGQKRSYFLLVGVWTLCWIAAAGQGEEMYLAWNPDSYLSQNSLTLGKSLNLSGLQFDYL